MPHSLIFDIGKTNKKCLVFDHRYQKCHQVYRTFEEIEDEDGHPSDNLTAIQNWIKRQFKKVLKDPRFDIQSVNFSTYGATLVYLDKEGKVLTPLYNYTKPYPKKVLHRFHKKHGAGWRIAGETASPPSGMLNAGLQLYWLKTTYPKLFKRVKYALHFPQYLSYLFTGQALSEYTSIGCHTSLWHYKKQDYHPWVYREGLDKVLPPITPTNHHINSHHQGRSLKIGVGIHDSSAALLPYLKADPTPFLLLSTGTWSVALNPFNNSILKKKDLQNDSLNYLRINGQAVKATRLFLGYEFQVQINQLRKHFQKKKGYFRRLTFQPKIYQRLTKNFAYRFHFKNLPPRKGAPKHTQLDAFKNFKEAYYQLMIELVEWQAIFARQAIGTSKIKRIYIDGGFANNDIFVHLLQIAFPDCQLRTTQSPDGSALGAAMVLSDQPIPKRFLKKQYAMKKH